MVYEPEAASIYARLLPVDKLVGENGDVILKAFDPGRKFIVVDAGGTVLFMWPPTIILPFFLEWVSNQRYQAYEYVNQTPVSS